MNILGIGGWEFVAILLIALIVAGPKRMIHWAYIMGRYVGKLRIMWAETMAMVQKEIDEAGVDIQLPKEPPTRQSINTMAAKAFEPFTKPLQETVAEVEAEAKKVGELTKLPSINGQSTNAKTDEPPQSQEDDKNQGFGTWSNAGNQQE